jgi:putative FmdB family regulatory protein
MPIYEYAHETTLDQAAPMICPMVVEFQQSIKDDAYTECPKCGGKIKRVISRVNFTWKNGPPTPKHYS